MKVNYRTDTGKRRSHNEDSIIVDRKKGIFLLADGMGGHQAGEVASRMAVEVAYDHLLTLLKPDNTDTEIFRLMVSALLKAHRSIKMSSTEDNLSLMGMGTTLILMLVRMDIAYICHAGDSRAYLMRKDIIKQVTRDQTWGNYLIDQKNVAREKVPPQSWHILTQAVGVTNKIIPELKKVRLKEDDMLLLCSDGLTDMLPDKEIKEIARKYLFDRTAIALVEEANKKGGKDNISVVLVKYKRSEIKFECTTCRTSPQQDMKMESGTRKTN
ncbi:protein phosphatase 2C domain-containing protein [Desulfobacterales bacterium HSG2]|nr:protein phosphatase 2C domain-containing protein [Desulfobacterales bacterium HSG2]